MTGFMLLAACAQSTKEMYEEEIQATYLPESQASDATVLLNVEYHGLTMPITDSAEYDALKDKDRDGNGIVNKTDYTNFGLLLSEFDYDLGATLFPKNVGSGIVGLGNLVKANTLLTEIDRDTTLLSRLTRTEDIFDSPYRGPLQLKHIGDKERAQWYLTDSGPVNTQNNLLFNTDSIEGIQQSLVTAGNHLAESIAIFTNNSKWARVPIGQECNNLEKVFYSEQDIPPLLRKPLRETVALYMTNSLWMNSGIEFCSDAECNNTDQVGSTNMSHVQITISNETLFVTVSCSSGFSCFPGEALLKTRDGVISFEDLAEQQGQGLPLPMLASVDENTGQTVYQEPTGVIDHGFKEANFIHFALIDESGNDTTLTVTDNHRLLVLRDGKEMWLKAGDIDLKNDFLIGENGETFYINDKKTKKEQTNDNLYNLSFTNKPEFEGSHTYLVSMDGENWITAHNIK